MSTNATEPAGRSVIASYGEYTEAQRAVDFLSDQKFPVEHLTIVGSGLKLVETVTGRLSWGRAVGAGAASGLWFGLLIGWFVAIFSRGTSTIALIFWGAIWGVIAGVVFSLIAYAMTGGRRDFISHRELLADSYDVTVAPDHAEAARSTLAGLA